MAGSLVTNGEYKLHEVDFIFIFFLFFFNSNRELIIEDVLQLRLVVCLVIRLF